ncbi:MAG: DNA-formamidopyrimidine glycosylase [Chloroflexota bacterium]|nr:DNA-formamidopyrimidine glycosylase [Chloroflexota bacterium]
MLNGNDFDRRGDRIYNDYMPELPEVETVARGLRASLVGRTIIGVEVRWARSVVSPSPTVFARRLMGQTVTGVGRRGKWVVITLSGGGTLLVHLRMTGKLILERGESTGDRHTRVSFSLDDGRNLRFSDQRKFGRLHLMDEPAGVLGELGPEPLSDEFTAARLGGMLARRRGRIKPLLLNQRFLAGLGNIYTDEALWRARIHPLRQAAGLTPVDVRRLHRAIQSVLRAAIAAGGTTLPDATYQQVDGRSGEFSDRLAVYGRVGQPCPRCGTTIERFRVSQRGTCFCRRCQPLPEDRF